MCGIVGVSGEFSKELFLSSVQKIKHRGPDDDGVYFNDSDNVGLGHTRLSIIDVSQLGHQPMFSDDSSSCLVFNGEIYNYKNLRNDLENKGYSFKSNSDTEVVLKMLQEHGIECLKDFNGIFSLAYYDIKNNDLFIARDGLGIKPLYYYSESDSFYFSSEIKAIQHLLVESQFKINIESLQKYLTYLWCPGEGTPAIGLRKVLPGEYIFIKNSKIVEKKSWYELPQAKNKKSNLNKKDIIKKVKQTLYESVERQMMSDVPLGAFLSGGLDSSSIVAMAKKISPNIRCYTIDSIGGTDDFAEDLPYAKKVANHLDVDLEIVKVDPDDLAKDLENMIWHLEEPLADPAPLNVLYISKLARERGIKVLLSGSGGDDLFTGYRRHLALRYEKFWSWLPIQLRNQLEFHSNKLDQNKPFGRRLSRLFNQAGASGNERLISFFEWLKRDDLIKLFSKEVKHELELDSISKPMMDFLKSIDINNSNINKMLCLEQRFFLSDHNLIYTDKMSMAEGVEVRVPFLDIELVKLAAEIPDSLKQRGTEGKWILKKAMEDDLPKDVIYRPKTGFGAPLRRWIKNDLKEMVNNLLSEESIKNRGIFDYQSVSNLIQENDKGIKDVSYTIFSLLCIEIWCRRFIDNKTAVNNL